MSNKLFATSKVIRNQSVSKVKYNREYLISNNISDELNAYKKFGVFPSFNDIYQSDYSADPSTKTAKEITSGNKIGAPATRAIFNKYSAVLTGKYGEDPLKASEWRLSNNVPLMDSPSNRQRIRMSSGCTVKELVKASESGILGRETYSYSDFMYCKHLGKVSNNYMITLRRFALPVDDFISSVGLGGRANRKEGLADNSSTSLGCMVTWLGVSGNEMNNILKYSMKMPFQEETAQWEEPQGGDADSQTGFLNSVAATFDPRYQYEYSQGAAGPAFNSYVGKMFGMGSNPYNVQQFFDWRDNKKVYGPVDAVKSTYRRSDRGLEFDQTMTLVFEYELRAYNGINGRQAMLDLISNILNVVYTTGTFWGGGYRSAGSHQSNVFANMNIFKASSVTQFYDAFANDISNLKNQVGDYFSSQGGILKGALNFLNNFGGMLLGGMLNKLGRPSKMYVNSLLSPAPVGFWHVTIGNPHHPIMSLGNMIVTNATVEHMGPLGLDDFPTGLKITVELTRGKPRDIKDIEKIYMHGNDRIYLNMGPKIEDMYKHATECRSSGSKYSASSSSDPMDISSSKSIDSDFLKNSKNTNIKYFGTDSRDVILTSASEQDYGSSPSQTNK